MRNFIVCIACLFLFSKISDGLPLMEPGMQCHQPADIIFVVDTSSSIWPEDFNKHVKTFLKEIVGTFKIGPGPLDTRVGVLLFGTVEYLQFHLNRYKSLNDTLRAIENIKYKGGDTYTHEALEYTLKYMLTPEKGSRQDVSKIVIVITDGQSINTKKTIAAADKIKAKGVDIFAIGVGDGVDFKELYGMASSPSDHFVYQVTDFRALSGIKQSFSKVTCEVLSTTASTVPSTTTTTTTTTAPTTTTTTPTTTTTTPTTTTTTPTTTTTTPTTTTTTPTTTTTTTTPTTTPTTTTTTSTTTPSTTTSTTTTTTSTSSTTSTTRRPRPDEPQQDEACQGKPADIYFLLDASSSVWIVHFQDQVLPFVRDLVSSFHISPLHTRIGLVTFSDIVNPEFNLSAYTDRKSLLASIQPEHVEYLTGLTNTGDAIKYVSDIGFGPDHAREGISQVIITITDGQSQNTVYTARAAAEAKKKGIIMFAIGVGQSVDQKELTDISSDPDEDFVFHVDKFTALSTITELIASKTCDAVSGDMPQTMHKCSEISSNVVFVYEYLNSVSASKIVLDDLVSRFTEKASSISQHINIGTLTQPCVGEGVSLLGVRRFQEALATVRGGYDIGYPSLLTKLRVKVFYDLPVASRKVAVLVVDQATKNWDLIAAEAAKLKAMNVEIFVVAVGLIPEGVLENIASIPKDEHIIRARRFVNLRDVKMDVLNIVCGLSLEKPTRMVGIDMSFNKHDVEPTREVSSNMGFSKQDVEPTREVSSNIGFGKQDVEPTREVSSNMGFSKQMEVATASESETLSTATEEQYEVVYIEPNK